MWKTGRDGAGDENGAREELQLLSPLLLQSPPDLSPKPTSPASQSEQKKKQGKERKERKN